MDQFPAAEIEATTIERADESTRRQQFN